MKQQNPRQYAGVWLDSHKAMIITNTPKTENGDYSIQDKVQANEYHGGKGEHFSNNAEQANNLKYFKSVSNLLLPYDEILVFGPGKSQEQFLNFLHEDAQFKSKKITIDSAEQLTDPQIIAQVRDFFKSHQS